MSSNQTMLPHRPQTPPAATRLQNRPHLDETLTRRLQEHIGNDQDTEMYVLTQFVEGLSVERPWVEQMGVSIAGNVVDCSVRTILCTK